MAKHPGMKRGILGLLAAGLMMLGAWPKAQGAVICNADDLRGTWVFNLTRILGNTVNQTFYLQVSLGGTASASNTTIQVLSGTTYEDPARTVTVGSMTISGDGAVYGVLNLNYPTLTGSTINFDSQDAGTGTPTAALRDVNYTQGAAAGGATIRRGLAADKNNMFNDRDSTLTLANSSLLGTKPPP